MDYREPDSIVIGRIQSRLYEPPDEIEDHNQYCPMSYKKHSTLCMCEQLKKSFRSAMKDDYEKWGG